MSSVNGTHWELDTSGPLPRRQRRAVRAGVIFSLVFHTTALIALIAVPYLLWLWQLTKAFDQQAITIVARVEEQPAQPAPPPEVRVVTTVDQVTPESLEARLNEEIEKANARPLDDNRDEFDKLARRLERVSDEESVKQMADQFHQWLGTNRRATRPAEIPVAGLFDHRTAQIHDVRREMNEDGSWRYIFVMLDSAGRTMDTEMDDPEEGERQYQTFQRLKSFPLAEQAYRQMVMPLLDKLLDDKKQ